MSTHQDRWLEQKLTEVRQRNEAAAEEAERAARHAERDAQIAAIAARRAAMSDEDRARFDRRLGGLIKSDQRKQLHKREDDFIPGFEEGWT